MALDLEEGDEALADAPPEVRREAARKIAGEGKARSRSIRSSSTSSGGGRATAGEKVENELKSRLSTVLDRIAKTLEERGDDELATVLREDAGAMGQGLVSLTRNVKVLRSPLLILLSLVEPILAFGRVGRILVHRWQERRYRIATEREQEAQQNQYAPGTVVDGTVVGGA